MLVVFRMAAAGDVNLFDAEVDKYAAFRDLSTAADNAGACFLRWITIDVVFMCLNSLAVAAIILTEAE